MNYALHLLPEFYWGDRDAVDALSLLDVIPPSFLTEVAPESFQPFSF
jgi:hypothetical protein